MNSIINQKSYAKMNLFLHIVGRRSDGYHLLESLFVRIGLHDDIEFKLRTDDLITLNGTTHYIDNIEQDLMVKAGRRLQSLLQKPFGVDINITKRIPTGAGLGGGSSNCAIALLTLNKLWDLNLSIDELLPIATQLGADVPFFLMNCDMAFVEGIGEKITPIQADLKHRYVLLIKPNVHIATGKIFTNPNLKRDTNPIQYQRFFDDYENTHNDLQPLAELLHHEVLDDINQLKNLPNIHCVRMTGSGSCVFGLFESFEELESAFKLLPIDIQKRSFLTEII